MKIELNEAEYDLIKHKIEEVKDFVTLWQPHPECSEGFQLNYIGDKFTVATLLHKLGEKFKGK